MEGIAGGVHQKLDAVNYKIAIKQVTEELDAVKQWSAEHPKSLNVAKLLSDAEQAVNSNAELSIIKSKPHSPSQNIKTIGGTGSARCEERRNDESLYPAEYQQGGNR